MRIFKAWVEAMRLRTLPVSVAGVIYAGALGMLAWRFNLTAWLLCLIFAVLSQIASNFANEYYDYKAGFDKAGRVGPRRGVTEGDITPGAMKRATYLTLALACVLGIVLVALYGRWWMYLVGFVTALGVVAYSSGPYPLSHHGLGELAVVVFFGVVPVCLTFMLMGGGFTWWLLMLSVGIGLLGANVLIVNNYRDRQDDLAVGKRTLAVRFGLRAMSSLYLANGFLAVLFTLPAWMAASRWGWVLACVYLVLHFMLYRQLVSRHGASLNPLLGKTAILMLAYTLAFALSLLLP